MSPFVRMSHQTHPGLVGAHQRACAPTQSCARLPIGLLLAAATIVLAACGGDSSAEVTISGLQARQQCLSTASPLTPTSFFGRTGPDGTVQIGLQSDSRLPSTSDGVYLEVYQSERVAQNLGQPFALADPLELIEGDEAFDQPPVARAQVLLEQSCPATAETFAVVGTVVFDALGSDDGQRVAGRIRDAQLISVRDRRVVADDVSGSWDFVISAASHHHYFPSDRDGVPRGPAP